MDAITLGLIVALFVLQTSFIKVFNENYNGNAASFSFFYAVNSAIAVLCLILWQGGLQAPKHPLTILWGAAFGVMFVLALLVYGIAMKTGPLSYTSLLFSAGLVIPVSAGLLLFGERLSALQAVGFLLILATFYIVSRQKSGGDPANRVSPKWLFFVTLTFLSNGTLGFLSKSHQFFYPGDDTTLYLIVGFATSAAFSTLLLLWFTLVKKQKVAPMGRPGFWVTILVLGATNTAGNNLTMGLMGRMPAGVLFPIINGGTMLVVILVSRAVFGERITRRKFVGIAVGLAAILLLSLG